MLMQQNLYMFIGLQQEQSHLSSNNVLFLKSMQISSGFLFSWIVCEFNCICPKLLGHKKHFDYCEKWKVKNWRPHDEKRMLAFFTVWENEKFIWIFCQHLLKLSEKPSSAITWKYLWYQPMSENNCPSYIQGVF